MADNPTDRQRISPTGIVLALVLLGALLFWMFICTQRGGDVGSEGVDAPERLTEEEVR